MKINIKHICIITSSYPSVTNPVYTFLDNLVCAFADLGIQCTIISPNSISSNILGRTERKPVKWNKVTTNGNKIEIFSPNYISFSNKKLLRYNTANLTLNCFKRVVQNEFIRLQKRPDVLYGHFLIPSGLTAAYLGEVYNIPSFFAFGEDSTDHFSQLGNKKISRMLKNITGIISVSSENKKKLIDLGVISSEKIGVFPNAINSNIFYKRNKAEMRRKFGYSQDDFIVAFVGTFDQRKGSLRLSKALERLKGVKSIFIGNGSDIPTCNGILHIGKVPYEIIPEMLSAADVFVLPTLSEGCCNAIIEAMACGLPIISSNLPFNDDILWDDNSIRIDPMNIDDIRNAISLLKEDQQMRENFSKASLKHAASLNIEKRAKNILEFMSERISNK